MSKKKQHAFSKAVVIYCLLLCTIITVASLAICWRAGEINAGVVSTLAGLWGGELLLLCIKRVVGDGGTKRTQKRAEAATGENDRDGETI